MQRIFLQMSLWRLTILTILVSCRRNLCKLGKAWDSVIEIIKQKGKQASRIEVELRFLIKLLIIYYTLHIYYIYTTPYRFMEIETLDS